MTTQNAKPTMEEILAAARKNFREKKASQSKRRFAANELSADEVERLQNSSVTESQVERLRELGLEVDERPLSEGGTLSRYAAMLWLEEAFEAKRKEREARAAQPATREQLISLLNCGCEVAHIEGITFGDASKLLVQFASDARARQASMKRG